jgi:hypothetical protein
MGLKKSALILHWIKAPYYLSENLPNICVIEYEIGAFFLKKHRIAEELKKFNMTL